MSPSPLQRQGFGAPRPRFLLTAALAAINAGLAGSALIWLGCASPPQDSDGDYVRRGMSRMDYVFPNALDAAGCRVAVRGIVSNRIDSHHRGYSLNGAEELLLEEVAATKLVRGAAAIVRVPPGLDEAAADQAARGAEFELVLAEHTVGTQPAVTTTLYEVASHRIINVQTTAGHHFSPQAGEQFLAGFEAKNLKVIDQELLHPNPNDLPTLVGVRDLTAEQARERNHALVAANTLTLPHLLQTARTPDLRALKVTLQESVLDVGRNAELEKEAAEAAVAAGADPGAHRELSLLFGERVAIIKPMLAAVNDELANRQR